MSDLIPTVNADQFIDWIKSRYEDLYFRNNTNPYLPDFPDNCVYYDPDTQTHCLIGEWFSSELNILDMTLSDLDHQESIPNAGQAIDILADNDEIAFENARERDRLKRILTAFQTYADEFNDDNGERRRTWGEAIDLGMEHINYLNWESKVSGE